MNVGRMVKESSVEELSRRLAERPDFLITTVNRLPADQASVLRQTLHASRARLIVINRRLGQRALKPLSIAGLPELLEGSVGLVVSGEILLTAKQIVEFRKTHEDQLAVRGAVIEGQLYDTARVDALAQLPPRPVLLAQVAAAIESPIADVVYTIERLIGDVAWAVEQLTRKSESSTVRPQSTVDSPQSHTEPPPAPPAPDAQSS